MGLSATGELTLLTTLMTGRYISLHTADPGNTGADEVSGGSYARKAQGAFGNAGSNPTTLSNSADIDFATATASWGTVTHFGIWDAVSGGNFLGGYALSASKLVGDTDVARFPSGSLQVTAD